METVKYERYRKAETKYNDSGKWKEDNRESDRERGTKKG